MPTSMASAVEQPAIITLLRRAYPNSLRAPKTER
jgi:hypothetical protein